MNAIIFLVMRKTLNFIFCLYDTCDKYLSNARPLFRGFLQDLVKAIGA